MLKIRRLKGLYYLRNVYSEHISTRCHTESKDLSLGNYTRNNANIAISVYKRLHPVDFRQDHLFVT